MIARTELPLEVSTNTPLLARSAAPSPIAIDGAAPASGPATPATGRTPAWQRLLATSVTSPHELLALLDLDPTDPRVTAISDGTSSPTGHVSPDSVQSPMAAANAEFGLRVPRGYVARMRRGDPTDPLLLQVLPLGRELHPSPGFTLDPLAEATSNPTPGILHKYHGRLLLLVTGACAIHCRYCFRRHFPYVEQRLDPTSRQAAIAYIAADPTVREVILSGGDPLAASDDKLAALAADLAAVPHLTRLRIHTRLPVVLPERVDDTLLSWLTSSRLRPVMVLHVNHANELADSAVAAAIERLRHAGVTLLNQTVLLAGINDSLASLVALSEGLFELGVLPYYLHVLDRVRGAAHFDIPMARAQALAWELTCQLPGYLVPRLVREEPGAAAKVPIAIGVS